MLGSLVRAVKEKAKEIHNKSGRIEGKAEDGWIALDYGDVVIHILSSENRNYYRLEELWHNGKLILKIK